MRRRDALAALGLGLGAVACGGSGAVTRTARRSARTTPATSFDANVRYPAIAPLADELYQRRRARMRELAGDAHADVVLATSGATSFGYLVGANFGRSERLIALVLPVGPGADPVLIAPSFEVERVQRSARALTVRGWQESEDPIAMIAARLGPTPRVLVEPRTDYAVAAALARALPGATLLDGSRGFEELRLRKSDDELHRMRRAIAITEDAWANVFDSLAVGMTEADVARRATAELDKRGLEGEALVQFGPNAALPHGGPSSAPLTENTVVLIDGGATFQGWWSDITRTRWFGARPSEKFRAVYNLVHDAQSAAIAQVRPGVAAQEIDRAARAVIDRAGFQNAFTHRLGHGMGMNIHEAAYMVEGNPRPLEPGFVFSVEPGVYLPGELGVRLEDDVACGTDGPVLLSRRAPRLS